MRLLCSGEFRSIFSCAVAVYQLALLCGSLAPGFFNSILDLPLAAIFRMRARRFRLSGALLLCAFLASEIAFLGFPRRFKLFQFDHQLLSRKNLSTANMMCSDAGR